MQSRAVLVSLPVFGGFVFGCVVGCGAPSSFDAARSESRYEGTDAGARTPRAATITPDAGVAVEDDGEETNAGCHCPEITVRCRGGKTMYANADRWSCALDLPPVMCAAFGIADSARVDPRAMLDAAASPAAAANADAIFDFCAGKHEARHTCDSPDVSSCATETSGYAVAAACMESFIPQYCNDEGSSGGCQRLRLYLASAIAARDVNACICAGQSCGDCMDACLAAHPDVASTCRQAASSYCSANR